MSPPRPDPHISSQTDASGGMDTQRWTTIRSLFEAVDAAPEAEREGLLAAACAGDPDLRAEVESLLAAQADDSPFLASPVAEEAMALLQRPAALRPDMRLGPYRLLREIGHGGMGVVYLAERADGQFEQRVAIKLVRQGPLRGDLVRRFQRERRLLASLDHPGIARLLDGGVSEPVPGASGGLPYLVMEYVEGEPITDYARTHALSLHQRLSLFREVCAAVQHANRALIVHRDLKPSNILVASGEVGEEANGKGQGGHEPGAAPEAASGDSVEAPHLSSPVPRPSRAPRVKLLDFGIARLMDEADGDATRTAGGALTPTYAAPEQVRGEPATTATDVYALGVLLYELLTGARPYEVTGLTPSETERMICETVPPRPSAAVRASGVGGLSPEALARRLRGDLDTIVMRALEKDPARRYDSAAQLDDDLRRHLANLPIQARPSTAAYRVSRFVRRHAVGVGASALIALALVAGTLTTAYQARKAERRTAEVREMANTLLFDIHDAIRDLPGATPAREALVGRALAYLDALHREASGDPALALDLAAAYEQIGEIQGDPHTTNLGDLDGALESYTKAMALREGLWRRDSTRDDVRLALASSYGDVAVVAWWKGGETFDPDALRARAMHLLAPLASRAPEARHLLARIQSEQGWDLIFDGQYDTGLAHVDTAVVALEALARGRPDDLALRLHLWRAYSYQADGLSFSGQHRPVLDLMRDKGLPLLHALRQRHPRHPRVLYGLHIAEEYVSSAEAAFGNDEAELEAVRRSLAYADAMLKADATNQKANEAVGRAQLSLAMLLASRGQTDEADTAHRRAIALAQTRFDADPTSNEAGNRLALAQRFRCRTLAGAGRYAAALEVCRASIRTQEQANASGASSVLQGNLGSAYGHTARIYRALAQRASGATRRAHLEAARQHYARGVEILEAVRDGKEGDDAGSLNWEVHPDTLATEYRALTAG